MKIKWRKNLNSPEEKIIKLRTAATAFMDDTTWIVSSKTNMQRILNEAAIFYKANDSQINRKKSVLLTINASKENTSNIVLIGPNKEPLDKMKEDEFTRYLSVWIGEKDHKKFTFELLQRENFQITQTLKHKKTTDNQVLYILNRVLIPRLEYRAQHCFFTEKKCKKLTVGYMRSFKNSINISKTCPNSIMLHKGIYSLKSMWEIQSEALLSNFTNRINDIGITDLSTRIRLKDAQISNWEPTNIIKTQLSNSFNAKNNFQTNILRLVHDYNIKYQGNNLHDIFEWQERSYPIKEIMKDHKLYKKSIKCLAKANLMFIDQLIDKNNKLIISWQILTSLLGKNNKGRIPNWYTEAKKEITIKESNKLNSIYENLNFVSNYYTWINNIILDKRIKDWTVTLFDNQKVIWSKITEKGNKNKQLKKVIISHYTIKENKNKSFELIPCPGCELNNPKLNIESSNFPYKFKTNRKDVKGIRYLNQKKLNKKVIPYDKEAFESNIRNEFFDTNHLTNSNTSTSYIPIVKITDLCSSLIHVYKWISTEFYKDLLIKVYNDNLIKDKD